MLVGTVGVPWEEAIEDILHSISTATSHETGLSVESIQALIILYRSLIIVDVTEASTNGQIQAPNHHAPLLSTAPTETIQHDATQRKKRDLTGRNPYPPLQISLLLRLMTVPFLRFEPSVFEPM